MTITDTGIILEGAFKLEEIKDGVSTILHEDHNLIVNRAKKSMAELMAGSLRAKYNGVYIPSNINRFGIGSGAHTGTSITSTPVVENNELFAATKRAGGDLTQQEYYIDFWPKGQAIGSSWAQDGVITDINEYDTSAVIGGSFNPSSKLTLTTPSTVDLVYNTTTDTTGTFINGLTYTFTIPQNNANQDPATFDATNPVYYSEAGLFVRKGDLQITTGNAATSTDLFALKTFPPRPKSVNSKWVITWAIQW